MMQNWREALNETRQCGAKIREENLQPTTGTQLLES